MQAEPEEEDEAEDEAAVEETANEEASFSERIKLLEFLKRLTNEQELDEVRINLLIL